MFKFESQRGPFGNFFPRIEVRVATTSLGFVALTVAEMLAFKVWVKFPSLCNQLRKS